MTDDGAAQGCWVGDFYLIADPLAPRVWSLEQLWATYLDWLAYLKESRQTYPDARTWTIGEWFLLRLNVTLADVCQIAARVFEEAIKQRGFHEPPPMIDGEGRTSQV